MGQTNAKGELVEATIFADLQGQGDGVAILWGRDLPFDLIVIRKEDGALERCGANTPHRMGVLSSPR